MAWFRRRRTAGGGSGRGTARAEARAEVASVRAHLQDFVRTRRGVEAYLEPPTAVTPPTVVLIATDGEWTRRRLPDPGIVRELAESLSVPVYDVQLTGYPQRMRDWNERARRDRRPPG